MIQDSIRHTLHLRQVRSRWRERRSQCPMPIQGHPDPHQTARQRPHPPARGVGVGQQGLQSQNLSPTILPLFLVCQHWVQKAAELLAKRSGVEGNPRCGLAGVAVRTGDFTVVNAPTAGNRGGEADALSPGIVGDRKKYQALKSVPMQARSAEVWKLSSAYRPLGSTPRKISSGPWVTHPARSKIHKPASSTRFRVEDSMQGDPAPLTPTSGWCGRAGARGPGFRSRRRSRCTPPARARRTPAHPAPSARCPT